MVFVSKATSVSKQDAAPASVETAPDRSPIGAAAPAKNQIPGLQSRPSQTTSDERPRSSCKIRRSNTIGSDGEVAARRDKNGEHYEVIRHHEPGTGHSQNVVGTRTADGRFDVKDPETGETLKRLTLVDSVNADGTAGPHVGVDPNHARLPGGMWNNGYASHRRPPALE